MKMPDPADMIAFSTPQSLLDWLAAHGDDASELWVKIYKLGSQVPSVTWEDCVIAALSHGWIDGISKSLGKDAYLQRLTPRKPKSVWSKRNRDHVDRLIASGLMTPAGLAQVEAAKADGRWDAAYAGPAEAEVPADFLAALEGYPKAKATYATLNKQNLYAIYYRLHSARSAETRGKRIAALIATLDKGERFH
jgi:uncharacterized protein YdeI (YjbR/CyaY-like superfamily)